MLAYIFPAFFFFNDTATTDIYTLSLHDALPISPLGHSRGFAIIANYAALYSDGLCSHSIFPVFFPPRVEANLLVEVVWEHPTRRFASTLGGKKTGKRSEEHTSELQSHLNLVCRL